MDINYLKNRFTFNTSLQTGNIVKSYSKRTEMEYILFLILLKVT